MASSVPDVGPEDDPGAEVAPPDVSIVVPTYNRREQLLKTLAALDVGRTVTSTGETFTLEVIVVSDGSTDGTVEAARSLEVSFPLFVLEQENGGPAAARNTGIEESRGDLIVFIDDDVIPEPQCVAAHVERHLDEDDLVVIGPMLTPPSGLTPWVAWEQRQLEKQYARFAVDPTAYHRQFYTGNASVPRAALVAAGGFDTSYRRAEDVELAHRLHLAGMTFLFEERARAYHHAERSFESWKRVGRDYGVNDVAFGRSGQPESLRLIGVFFRERHLAQRGFFGIVAPRPRFARLVEWVLDRCIHLADKTNNDRVTQQLLRRGLWTPVLRRRVRRRRFADQVSRAARRERDGW